MVRRWAAFWTDLGAVPHALPPYRRMPGGYSTMKLWGRHTIAEVPVVQYYYIALHPRITGMAGDRPSRRREEEFGSVVRPSVRASH
jgi:hypothetical protein